MQPKAFQYGSNGKDPKALGPFQMTRQILEFFVEANLALLPLIPSPTGNDMQRLSRRDFALKGKDVAREWKCRWHHKTANIIHVLANQVDAAGRLRVCHESRRR
jgi:hypothetical protein